MPAPRRTRPEPERIKTPESATRVMADLCSCSCWSRALRPAPAARNSTGAGDEITEAPRSRQLGSGGSRTRRWIAWRFGSRANSPTKIFSVRLAQHKVPGKPSGQDPSAPEPAINSKNPRAPNLGSFRTSQAKKPTIDLPVRDQEGAEQMHAQVTCCSLCAWTGCWRWRQPRGG